MVSSSLCEASEVRIETFWRRVTNVFQVPSTFQHFLLQSQFLISCVESRQQVHWPCTVCVLYIKISCHAVCHTVLHLSVCVVVLFFSPRSVRCYCKGVEATSQQEGTEPSKPSCTLITGNLNSQTLSHSLCSLELPPQLPKCLN